jgi:SAM-dependent methyltransferase
MQKNKYRYLNIYYWLRKFSFSSFFQKTTFFLPEGVKRKFVFFTIYKSNHWRSYNEPNINESVSGLGSDLKQNSVLVVQMQKFIKEKKIKRVLDLACGDFNWMKYIIENNPNVDKYLGLDIVDNIIKNNKLKYENSKINFKINDIIKADYPENFDLIFIRDVFIHIKNKEIISVLNKLKKNSAKFVVIGTYHNIDINKDLNNYGHHRELNIEIAPFNLGKPFVFFSDNEKQRSDRRLNIYKFNEKS